MLANHKTHFVLPLLVAGVIAAPPPGTPQTAMPTLAYKTLDVVSFPLTTTAPSAPSCSHRPRLYQAPVAGQYNTVCGYIGGNPNLPATCKAGSHCVLDVGLRVVGCCPNSGPCTVGIFTGCVDRNSGPQSVVNPYVHTCEGGGLCYKNVFDGGFYQYGCGTASNMGTSVSMSHSGTSPILPLTSVPMTMTPSPSSKTSGGLSNTPSTKSSEVTSSSTGSSSTSDGSSSMSSNTALSSSTASVPSSTASSAGVAPSATQAPVGSSGRSKVGAIIGGVLSGLVLALGALCLGLFCWRRNKRNTRSGPGLNDKPRQIEPVTGQPFARLPRTDTLSDEPLTPARVRGGAAPVLPLPLPTNSDSGSPDSLRYRVESAGTALREQLPRDSDTTPLRLDNEQSAGGGEDLHRHYNDGLSEIYEVEEEDDRSIRTVRRHVVSSGLVANSMAPGRDVSSRYGSTGVTSNIIHNNNVTAGDNANSNILAVRRNQAASKYADLEHDDGVSSVRSTSNQQWPPEAQQTDSPAPQKSYWF